MPKKNHILYMKWKSKHLPKIMIFSKNQFVLKKEAPLPKWLKKQKNEKKNQLADNC